MEEKDELAKALDVLVTPSRPINTAEIPNDFTELRNLQPDAISVASCISNLKWHWEFNQEATRKIFLCVVDVLRKYAAAARSFLHFRKRMDLYITVLRDFDDRQKYLPEIVSAYLKDTYLQVFTVPGMTVNVAKAELFADAGSSRWFREFLVALYASGVGVTRWVVAEFVGAVVRKCSEELRGGEKVIKGVHAAFYGNVIWVARIL
ncbi:hypothetical protein HK097_002517, partial [Rhizophlyctis rosea]